MLHTKLNLLHTYRIGLPILGITANDTELAVLTQSRLLTFRNKRLNNQVINNKYIKIRFHNNSLIKISSTSVHNNQEITTEFSPAIIDGDKFIDEKYIYIMNKKLEHKLGSGICTCAITTNFNFKKKQNLVILGFENGKVYGIDGSLINNAESIITLDTFVLLADFKESIISMCYYENFIAFGMFDEKLIICKTDSNELNLDLKNQELINFNSELIKIDSFKNVLFALHTNNKLSIILNGVVVKELDEILDFCIYKSLFVATKAKIVNEYDICIVEESNF